MDSARPLGRSEGLLTEQVDDELLVYDESNDVACRLNATAALIWRNCDGRRTLSDLVAILREEVGEAADEDMVSIALDDLVEHGLIASGYEPRELAAVRLSRRRFFRRAGVAGAAAIAAPVVYSMAVPAAAAALSAYDDYGAYVASDRRLKRNIRTLRGHRS